jgi:hypothetical protein
MLTALSIIKARVAGEKQNAIDVAWNIGGHQDGWLGPSLRAIVERQISRAREKGLFNVKLLGYWMTKHPSAGQPEYLDAVLVAKMPTDDPRTVLDIAFFFDLDLENDDEAFEKIVNDSDYELEKIKRNQTYFSYRGSYILGEFKKA